MISPSRVSTSCEVNITLRATETSKLIEFDLTYSMESSELGPQIRMANNTNHARGFFIDSANVYFSRETTPSNQNMVMGGGKGINSHHMLPILT